MTVVAVETALTLANSIVELVSKRLEKKKIEGQDFEQLQKWTQDLRGQLKKSSDIEKSLNLLTKTEVATSYTRQLKDLANWVDGSQPYWGEESEQKGHVIWDLVQHSINVIDDKIETDLGDTLNQLTDVTKREHYRNFTSEASLHAEKVKAAKDWAVVESEIDQVEKPLRGMITSVQDDIREMTNSLFATTAGPSPKLSKE